MAVKIITADERMRESLGRTTAAIFGIYGVGKTSLLYTLDAESTLAFDFEGGFKSVMTWQGDSIEVRSWQDAIDLACYIGGPDPAEVLWTNHFSKEHYEHCVGLYGSKSARPIDLAKYKTIFFDSISDLIAAKMKHAQSRNMVMGKNKEMTLDTRGAYGDVGREGMQFIRHMQHCDKNVIWIGRLEMIIDEFKREIWQPQLDGQKVARELPGVVDQVITMSFFDYSDAVGWTHNPTNGALRAFVCQRRNPWGLPAKERTMGNLEMVEEPHLGKLIEKINQPAKAMVG